MFTAQVFRHIEITYDIKMQWQVTLLLLFYFFLFPQERARERERELKADLCFRIDLVTEAEMFQEPF